MKVLIQHIGRFSGNDLDTVSLFGPDIKGETSVSCNFVPYVFRGVARAELRTLKRVKPESKSPVTGHGTIPKSKRIPLRWERDLKEPELGQEKTIDRKRSRSGDYSSIV
jgi:hypothetical protein